MMKKELNVVKQIDRSTLMLDLDALMQKTPAEKFKVFRSIGLSFKYNCFAYKIVEHEEDFQISAIYDFRVEPLFNFCPSFSLKLPKIATVINKIAQRENLEYLLLQIGLMESLSYWKAFCPVKYALPLASLDKSGWLFWQDCFFNGLGEMLYRNNISIAKQELVAFQSTHDSGQVEFNDFTGQLFQQISALNKQTEFATLVDTSWRIVEHLDLASLKFIHTKEQVKDKVLIPVGGGKDSIVSLELLKNSKFERYAFAINPSQACLDSMRLAEIKKQNCLFIERKLDRRIVELNKMGFLNGHTPFSGIVAFYSYLVAYLMGIPYIALSNEASSNVATIEGSQINHQYSKTSQFEQSFQAYVEEYMGGFAYYFSFLRAFNEIAIAQLFAKYKAYYSYFRSCNLGSKAKANLWCGNCAKCLFVYIILSLYLDEDELKSIFQGDLLDNANLEEDLSGLLGVTAVKPFECVGTVSEVSYVISKLLNAEKNLQRCLLIKSKQWIEAGLCPYIVCKNSTFDYVGADPMALQPAPLIPREFLEILKSNTNKELGD